MNMTFISPESDSQVQHQLADLAVLDHEKLLHKDKTELANLYCTICVRSGVSSTLN